MVCQPFNHAAIQPFNHSTIQPSSHSTILTKEFAVKLVIFIVKANEGDFGDGRVAGKKVQYRFDGYGRCAFFGEAINTGADIGEGDGFQSLFHSQLKALPIARGQQTVRLFWPVIAPSRTDGMDDVFSWQAVPFGYPGFAGWAAVQPAALLKKRRACGPVDGAVHATAAEQGVVGSVDDSPNRKFGNISIDEFYPVHFCCFAFSHATPQRTLRAIN